MFGVMLKQRYLKAVVCLVLLEPNGRKLILAVRASLVEGFSSFALNSIQ